MIFNETESATMCKKIVEISTHNGRLDLKELDNRLGMFVTDKLLGFIKFRRAPVPPQSIAVYKSLTGAQKIQFNKENPFWKQETDVTEWLDKASKADAQNKGEVWWLKYWITVVDKDRQEKLREKLAEFPPILTREEK